jgi:hypothetical protein
MVVTVFSIGKSSDAMMASIIRRLDPVERGHRDVQDDDVGGEPAGGGNKLCPV